MNNQDPVIQNRGGSTSLPNKPSTSALDTIVGRALVSQVFVTRFKSCGRPGCRTPLTACPIPENARNRGCRPGTVDPAAADCFECWYDQHHESVPNGGTRIGPVHYFDDCQLVTKPRHQREDARLIPMTAEMIEALRLPACRHCAARLAELEAITGGTSLVRSPAGGQIVQP